jgi:cation:H+ antiporter
MLMNGLPLWLNVVAFALTSLAIAWAGTRLERYADQISEQTGLGQAFTGMMLLAVATSLPELATSLTAVLVLDNPTLAVHNLLGSAAMQTALIAAADMAKRDPGALTFFSPQFGLLLQGLGLLLLLQCMIAGVASGGVPVFFDVSLWSVLLLVAYLGMTYLVYRYRGQPRWTPSREDDVPDEVRRQLQRADGQLDVPTQTDSEPRRAIKTVWTLFGAMSALVLVAGWLAAEAADVLAEQTGLGSAFLGATLLALATSMPEVTTTFAAVRHRRYTVAISNIFGSNAFCVVLLLPADILYRNGAILVHAESSVIFIGAVTAVMTCIYLWGLIERENRTFLGIGWDSVAVLVIYGAAMAVLYGIT